MRSRKILTVGLLFFVLFIVLETQLTLYVRANPIPYPTLLMPEEYIDVTISRKNGVLWAAVDGEYPFENLDVNTVTMYYPVPPSSPAEKTSVKIDDTSLSWSYCEPPKMYPTVVGDFPMIYWVIIPVPQNFTIKTHYEHPLPIIDEKYSFLYATGTGRYLGHPYAKETTAYIKMHISKDVAPRECQINVYTVANVSGDWVRNPANYVMTPDVGKWEITLTLVSELFAPLEEDTLVTIQSSCIGGVSVPIDRPSLSTSYICLASTILIAAATTALYVKRTKRRKEKR